MKFTKYSKYVPDPAGEMSMEDLLNALSDYLLQSGFQNPFSNFYELNEGEHNIEDLRRLAKRRVRVGELLRHPGKLHTIIVSSTVLPSTVIALSEQASKVGLDLIDAAVNGVAGSINLWSRALRLIQSGEVQHYALAMALGAVVILGVYMLL